MEIVVGTPVTGEDLYGRELELDRLWDRIRNNSILLSSPRRFGKASLVKEMKRAPRGGFEVVYLDVEGIDSVEDFVTELGLGLPEKPRQNWVQRILKGIIESFEEIEWADTRFKLREIIKKDWARRGSELFIMLQNLEKRHIIVIDELPSFLLNLETQSQDIETFLRWLRQMRQAHDARFILCGSIGIDGILRRHTLSSAINDLERRTVPAFDRNTASRMIEDMLDKDGIKYETTHVQKILDKIGTPSPPYFIQVMLLGISDIVGREKSLSENIVNKAYQSVLNENGREYFDWYYERLSNEFPPDQIRAVVNMLDHLSQHESCTKQDLRLAFFNMLRKDDNEAFIDAIRTLESGFYIAKDNGYSFRVKVLRDWWAERRIH